MDLFILIGIFLLAFIAMFVGALSGGVGLITRPILLLLGYSPQIVVGTSRASSIIGELPGIIILYKNKKSDKNIFFLAIPMAIGILAAVFFTLSAQTDVLRIVIGLTVLAMALFIMFKNKFATTEENPKFSRYTRETISFIGTTIIAFLSTLSGGLGILYTAFYAWLYGKTYIGASAMWRIASYMGGLIASIIFIIKGVIDWQLFIALAAGFTLGSYFGVHFALKKGEKWVRYTVIVIALLSSIKLLLW